SPTLRTWGSLVCVVLRYVVQKEEASCAVPRLVCLAEVPAVGTALAGTSDRPVRRIPGHGHATTAGCAMAGVFLRLGDHRRSPYQDVMPRGVAVDRVAPVLAAPVTTVVE